MLTANQRAILTKVDEVLAFAKTVYPSCHSMHFESIKWIKGTVGGRSVVKGGKYYLEFNAEATEKYFDDMLNDTVAHEIAHSVVECLFKAGQYGYYRPKAHGREWRRVAVMLGAKPDRCHSYDLTPARVTKKYNYNLPIAGIIPVGAKHHKAILDGKRIMVKSTKEVIMSCHYAGRA